MYIYILNIYLIDLTLFTAMFTHKHGYSKVDDVRLENFYVSFATEMSAYFGGKDTIAQTRICEVYYF